MIDVPLDTTVEQVVPQLMPPRSEVTVPRPDVVTVSVAVGVGWKVAVTLVLAVSVKVQGFVDPFAQTPLQPAKILVAPGVAVIVSAVPEG